MEGSRNFEGFHLPLLTWMLGTLYVLPLLVCHANNDLSISVKRVQNGEAKCRTITTIDEKTVSEEVYPKVPKIRCTLTL